MAILPVNLQILHSCNGEPVAKLLRYSDEKTTSPSPDISLLVPGLWDIILTSLFPSIPGVEGGSQAQGHGEAI